METEVQWAVKSIRKLEDGTEEKGKGKPYCQDKIKTRVCKWSISLRFCVQLFYFFPSTYFSQPPTLFFFFLRNMKTFTLKIFPKSFLSLKVHGRIGLLLEDKWYTAFIPEGWQPKACVLSKDGILGALLTCACCTIQILSCNGVTSHPQ